MNDIVRVDHVFDYNDSLGCETLHPLVSVIDFSEVRPIRSSLRSFGVYAIFLKRREVRRHDLRPPDLRLSGRNARLSRTRTGLRREGRRTAAPAQRLGASLPPRSAARHAAGAQHPQLHLFFLRGARSLHLRSRSGARSSTAYTTSATSCSTPSTATAAR